MPREHHDQAPFKRRVAGSSMLMNTRGRPPHVQTSSSRRHAWRRRHAAGPGICPRARPGPRMWCPRWIFASSCMTARRSCIIGILRAGTSDRSRGHPSSSTMRRARAGTSRGTTARAIPGLATMTIAPTSSTAITKAGQMDRPATLVGTTGSSTATTAPAPTADSQLRAEAGRDAPRPAFFPMLGSHMQQPPWESRRCARAGLLARWCSFGHPRLRAQQKMIVSEVEAAGRELRDQRFCRFCFLPVSRADCSTRSRRSGTSCSRTSAPSSRSA